MTAEPTSLDAEAPRRWTTLYWAGGVGLCLGGVAYLAITVTGAMIGVSPGDSERWLAALGARPTLSLLTYGVLTGIADLVLIPAALALCVALRPYGRSAAMIAAAILLVYVAVDLSTFVPTAVALTSLAQESTAVNDPVQRASLAGAMRWGSATIPFSQFFGWFVPSIGYLLFAVLIRRGRLGAATAILGIIASLMDIGGSLSFLFPGGYWDTFVTPGLALLGVFQVLAGLTLLRLARGSADLVAQKHPQHDRGAEA